MTVPNKRPWPRPALVEHEPTVPCSEKKRGRFLQGNAASRARGRPRNEYREALQAAITPADLAAIASRARTQALEGDRHARSFIADYMLGRPRVMDRDSGPVLLRVTTPAECVTANARILDALSRGQITPEEARNIAAVVDGARQALELVDLATRVAELENQRNGRT
jgi:hypothetical protein